MSVTSEQTRPIISPQQTLTDVTDQLASIPLHFPTRRRWLIALALSSLLLLLFCRRHRPVHARRRHLGSEHPGQLGVRHP
jgi:hypothetical protein